MSRVRLAPWLHWLRAASTFTFITALCLSVALLVIAVIPGSPVHQDLPSTALTGLGGVGGVVRGVHVDPAGWVPFTIHDASLGQRLLSLLPVLPGVVLIAEIARRMASLLRAAQDSDPFTADTAKALLSVGKLTAVAGLAVWVISQLGQALLVRTMLTDPITFKPHQTPLGWLAVGAIFAAFAYILDRGVAMRSELDAVI